MDVGTSGGVWGYKNGFCRMIGGDGETFKIIEPIIKKHLQIQLELIITLEKMVQDIM